MSTPYIPPRNVLIVFIEEFFVFRSTYVVVIKTSSIREIEWWNTCGVLELGQNKGNT